MCRKCVPQLVRMRRDAPQRARVEPPAARGDKERVLGAAHELRPCVAQIDTHRPRGFLTERDDALLAALAAHVDELLLEVDIGEVETDGLRAPQAGGVDELDERAIAKRERAVAGECVRRLLDLSL